MKKVILGALVLGASFACQKADVENNTLSSNDVVMTPTKASDLKRTWHDDGSRPWVMGQTRGCVGMGGTCPQTKSVLAQDVQMFEDIKSGGSIIAHFVNYEASLANYFSLTTIQNVILGGLSVEVLGDLETEMYFVFSEGGTVFEVMPLAK